MRGVLSKKKERIFEIMFNTLKEDNALQCNHCLKKTNEFRLSLGIDYENKILLDRECIDCLFIRKPELLDS